MLHCHFFDRKAATQLHALARSRRLKDIRWRELYGGRRP